ncbi:MAG: hypothetical protein RLN80_03470 [Rhodospirillales bacterium]
MNRKQPPFFVGYLPVPKQLALFLLVCALSLVAGFAGAGLLAGATQDDPGKGDFRFDLGRQTVTGVIELTPYPVLRVTIGNDHIPAGRTLMLSGIGKNGVTERAAPLAGRMATASGVLLSRGDLDMLQLRAGEAGLAAAAGVAPQMPVVPLGKWRLAGEICDGKCLTGAMRPGRGLAHKACANLCLIGGVPPVFVSSQPVDGNSFFLIAGPDGGPMPARAYDFVGQYIILEGEIERRGDLPVLRISLPTLEVL